MPLISTARPISIHELRDAVALAKEQQGNRISLKGTVSPSDLGLLSRELKEDPASVHLTITRNQWGQPEGVVITVLDAEAEARRLTILRSDSLGLSIGIPGELR